MRQTLSCVLVTIVSSLTCLFITGVYPTAPGVSDSVCKYFSPCSSFLDERVVVRYAVGTRGVRIHVYAQYLAQKPRPAR